MTTIAHGESSTAFASEPQGRTKRPTGIPLGERKSRNGAEAGDSCRQVIDVLSSQNVTQHQPMTACDIQDRRLLIRGFGVRVPGGAQSIKALTSGISGIRAFFMSTVVAGARGVLRSRWTVSWC